MTMILGLVAAGETLVRAAGATAPAEAGRLLAATHVDSIRPMVAAYDRKTQAPGGDLYGVFFADRVKFQYPPSSLLIFDVFPRAMTRLVDGRINDDLRRWWTWLSRAALALTLLVSAAILEIGVRRQASGGPLRPGYAAVRVGLSLALGAMFYPVMKAYSLGQIQVFLNALIALAVLGYLLGWRMLTGGCLGLCCLVKPQYGFVLLWGLVRRQWQFSLGFAGVLILGLMVSLVRFGLSDHLRYLDVVGELSRVGEAYWANQSVNGLLNRLLGAGSAVQFSRTELPVYHPLVHALTIISSGAILMLALWARGRGPRRDGSVIDLGAVLVGITMASPIAWEHHYGILLPVLAAALPGLIAARPFGARTGLWLALGYAAMANVMQRPALLFGSPWLGLAGSHLFFGSLIAFVLLLRLRSSWHDDQPGAGRQERAPSLA
ncbi:MAG: glycosyltransferase 87 family protein [Armatimonadota bacterium]|nr:glycosyltransferase 87 family protein [Armatimonadota bacterium]MDR7549344.1 glycosyltransferase 87 family protein [Armatimonadota bacterium]